ncbi:serine hydroxymethyltransferase [Streptomyces mashuensis]|uniref:Serine hydroxymethyltransferase n=1 Tax=Streptomyces mashuensis TaxID=33904 RepID=A0A919B478_9ACTN|nr:serine hydroxymethyltransferase [Streptomyces mashuensis]GHF50979.1 serine hydroxymethyltransferase [Streptomyces mashuensis]
MSATPAPAGGIRTAALPEAAPATPVPSAAPPPHPAWGDGFADLLRADPDVAGLLLAEAERQTTGLQLTAAENFASPAVLAALGSPLTNKYAEGYPGARHHGGCEIVDMAERLATGRATALFGADHANVQPHSGTAAVLAAYAAVLAPGDTVLALDLHHGGHLVHGSPATLAGSRYRFVGYGLCPETGLIDYDRVRDLARRHRPRALVCGSTSYPRHPDYAAFREIADETGAVLIVDAAHPIGLVAGGAAPSPVPYADVVCATTHKVLRGPRGGLLLCGTDRAGAVDRAVFPHAQGGAQMQEVAAKAVAFGEAATPAFAAYAHQVVANARALAAALAEEGFGIATGGTDTHLVAADVTPLGVDAATARRRLAAAAIVLDTCGLGPGAARGLRLGTAAITTQGLGTAEMAQVAGVMAAAVRAGSPGGPEVAEVRAQVAGLAGRFPPYRSHM